MEIIKVKIQNQGYILNGNMYVPKAEGNSEYESIKRWLAIECNIPESEFTDEEFAEQELQQEIQEYKLFLAKSDKKVLPYYEFEDGDNTLEWYVEERSKARKFIRANEVV